MGILTNRLWAKLNVLYLCNRWEHREFRQQMRKFTAGTPDYITIVSFPRLEGELALYTTWEELCLHQSGWVKGRGHGQGWSAGGHDWRWGEWCGVKHVYFWKWQGLFEPYLCSVEDQYAPAIYLIHNITRYSCRKTIYLFVVSLCYRYCKWFFGLLGGWACFMNMYKRLGYR